MYRVLGFPGRSRITPSNTVPKLGEETETPCASGIALSVFRGNSVVRKSSVAFVCLALIADTPPSAFSESSRLSGGVWRPVPSGCLCMCMISLGLTDGGGGVRSKRGRNSEESCSGGGVGGYWMREEPYEEGREEEREDWLGVGERRIGAGLSVTQSDDPLSGGHF